LRTRKNWRPYKDAINWFNGLSFVSKHLVDQSSRMLDGTKSYESTVSTSLHGLERDFSKEEIEFWLGPDSIFNVTDYASDLYSIMNRLESTANTVARQVAARRSALERTLGKIY
jgi:hypothetical protein